MRAFFSLLGVFFKNLVLTTANFSRSGKKKAKAVTGVGALVFLGLVADAAVQYKSEAFHGEVLVFEMAPDDFNKYGCDLVWRATDKASGREVARGKTGIIFFDYQQRKAAPVPAGFVAKTAPAA